MKCWILLLLSLVCCSVVSAAPAAYRVKARVLNVRSAPSKEAGIVSSVSRGEVLQVEEFTGDGWARISWQGANAYVSAQYLEESTSESLADKKNAYPFGGIHGGNVPEVPRHWLVYAVLLLSAILWIVVDPTRGGNSAHWGVGMTLFLLLVCCEIYSVLMLGDGCLWFCMPDEVGFVWMIVGFFIFGLVIFNQLLNYLALLNNMSYTDGWYFMHWDWGLWAWPAFVGALFVCGSDWTFYVICTFVLYQIGFIIWVVWRFARVGKLLTGFIAACFYLIGAVSILLLSVLYIPLLIIAGIVVLALCIISACVPKYKYVRVY